MDVVDGEEIEESDLGKELRFRMESGRAALVYFCPHDHMHVRDPHRLELVVAHEKLNAPPLEF